MKVEEITFKLNLVTTDGPIYLPEAVACFLRDLDKAGYTVIKKVN